MHMEILRVVQVQEQFILNRLRGEQVLRMVLICMLITIIIIRKQLDL